MQEIDIKKLRAGAVVCAKTESGNCYMFEIIDPEKCKAIVTRMQARPRASNTGNLGERFITQVIRVGEPVCHGNTKRNANTSEVTELEIK